MMKKSIYRIILTVFVLGILGVMLKLTEFEGEKTYRVVYIPKVVDETSTFWSALIEGTKIGAREYGVELTILAGKSEVDFDGQNRAIEEAIKKKPDVILLSPCGYTESTEAAEKIVHAGIDLILIDSELDKDIAKSVVSTDNYQAGIDLGDYTAGLLKENDKIGVVGYTRGASTAIEREKGFRDGLGHFEENIMEVVFCGSSYDEARKMTMEMIEKYPEISMIAGLNEYSAAGSARAIEEMGKSGQIQVVGFDCSVEQMQMMERGTFKGMVIQKPFNMGYLGIVQAVKVIDNKVPEAWVNSGARLITPENMYDEENQRLIYPLTGQ